MRDSPRAAYRPNRINVADPDRLVRALAWVDEVYPGRTGDGAAVVHMTWDEWNELRAALGLPVQPVPRRRTAA
ncbi:conserved protein of unknown function (plasmid) [Rhodovastum atsumiense]|uniref:Uncharacterized protein n=1 Tax=Rhodovastum atsumiense TaxID=504468 RepID=A0A5M6ITK2_9PROT|nr:hypothetical protein [Rhodovastum atsumiense]KAA5611653.1 hypothetical protein F1189_13920 [Rhodovastum atsumiense]CAH2606247.1 conserved protein of unknown function [Rhodovastum atsumiense]